METVRIGRPKWLPPPDRARADGLLAVGGRLSSSWLLDAYRHGIFPWPVDDILAWWSPDPRAVLEFDALHVSQRLRRTLSANRFTTTLNQDFAAVIEACAMAQDREENMWLTPQMRRAYLRMHRLGHAHSLECWRDGELAGGIYGIAVGAAFAAESMFYFHRDASKVALVRLVEHLAHRGFTLLDIQQLNPHTESMGGSEIPRALFLHRLARARSVDVEFIAPE